MTITVRSTYESGHRSEIGLSLLDGVKPTSFELTNDGGEVVVYTPTRKALPLTSFGAHIHTHTPGREGNHTHSVNGLDSPWMHEGILVTPPDGEQTGMYRLRFYVGGVHDPHKYDAAHRYLIENYNGYTEMVGRGAWRDPRGDVQREAVKVYEVLTDTNFETYRTARFLRELFDEESVIYTEESIYYQEVTA